MADEAKKWNVKQLGAGAGGSLLALFLLQNRGIDFMNKAQESSNQVIIEKTVANGQKADANSDRIRRVETELKDLRADFNKKIDHGFESVRTQIREDTGKLSDLVRAASNDRFTKTEHISYREYINQKFRNIEEDLRAIDKNRRKRDR